MDTQSPTRRRCFKVLKTVAFVLDKAQDESVQKAVKETVEYIENNGYKAIVADGKDPLPLSMSENRPYALVITDSSFWAKELSDRGYYCVGYSHSKNAGESFPGLKYVFSDIDDVDVDSFVKVYQRYAGEPWEVIETERLIIRETTVEDVDEFYKIYSDPDMTRFMEGLFENPEDEKRYQKDYIEKVYGLMGFGVWTLVRKEDGRVIGRAGYSVRNGFDVITISEDRENSREQKRSNTIANLNFSGSVYGKDVILFDDITTRGTSFIQAANALKARGSRSVYGLFIGRTVSC